MYAVYSVHLIEYSNKKYIRNQYSILRFQYTGYNISILFLYCLLSTIQFILLHCTYMQGMIPTTPRYSSLLSTLAQLRHKTVTPWSFLPRKSHPKTSLWAFRLIVLSTEHVTPMTILSDLDLIIKKAIPFFLWPISHMTNVSYSISAELILREMPRRLIWALFTIRLICCSLLSGYTQLVYTLFFFRLFTCLRQAVTVQLDSNCKSFPTEPPKLWMYASSHRYRVFRHIAYIPCIPLQICFSCV